MDRVLVGSITFCLLAAVLTGCGSDTELSVDEPTAAATTATTPEAETTTAATTTNPEPTTEPETTTAETSAPSTTWGNFSAACQSYLTYRDYLAGSKEDYRDNVEVSNAGVLVDAAGIEAHFDTSINLVEMMEAAATGDGALALGRYWESIEALSTLYAARGYEPIESVEGDLVPVVAESAFDTAERDVWRWAANVCGGRLYTNCEGFLSPLVSAGRWGSELYYLIDPDVCDE